MLNFRIVADIPGGTNAARGIISLSHSTLVIPSLMTHACNSRSIFLVFDFVLYISVAKAAIFFDHSFA